MGNRPGVARGGPRESVLRFEGSALWCGVLSNGGGALRVGVEGVKGLEVVMVVGTAGAGGCMGAVLCVHLLGGASVVEKVAVGWCERVCDTVKGGCALWELRAAERGATVGSGGYVKSPWLA